MTSYRYQYGVMSSSCACWVFNKEPGWTLPGKVNKRDPTELKKGIREMDGWMDGWMDDLRFDVLFNSISAGPRSAISTAPGS